MKKRIGVEDGQRLVREYLENQGYDVNEFSKSRINDRIFFNNLDVVVMLGQDKNMFGIQDSFIKAPIKSEDKTTSEKIENKIQKNKAD